MANPIGQRSKPARAPAKPRRQFLPEATAAADATGQILERRFGYQPWIEQVMEAVKHAVQNGVEQLSGSSITSNAHPDDGYRFRARTKEELLQSQQLAANNGNVRAGRAALDPAQAELGAPGWEDDEQPSLAPAPSPKAEGWFL